MTRAWDADQRLVVQVFLAETEEGLAAMEEALVALESRPRDEEALGTVFRVVHTLKGNAGSLGFPEVAGFAHALEDVLDRLRSRTLEVTGGLVTLLLGCADALRRMVPDAASGRAESRPEHRALEAQLASFRRGGAPASAAGRSVDGEPEAVWRAAFAPEEPSPERTLRVGLEKLDRMLTLTGEIAIARGRLREMLGRRGRASEGVLEAHQDMDRLCADLQELVMKVRMVPLGRVFRPHIRTVRDLATAQGKQARLVIDAKDVEADTAVVDQIRDPLTHMVRNALDHGIEPPQARVARGKEPCGSLTLRAYHDAGSVVVQLSDDGAGLERERIVAWARRRGLADPESLADEELYRLVFEPGFSTATAVTHLSGRGIGLDVVRRNVERLGGSVGIESRPGRGTTLSLRVPLTLAIIAGFAVGVCGETYVIPLDAVEECVELSAAEAVRAGGRGVLDLRGKPLPYLDLCELFAEGSPVPTRRRAVVVRCEQGRAGLGVDALYGESQIVIRPLGRLFRRLPSVAGSTILGDGRVALILDAPALLRQASSRRTDPARTMRAGA